MLFYPFLHDKLRHNVIIYITVTIRSITVKLTNVIHEEHNVVLPFPASQTKTKCNARYNCNDKNIYTFISSA